MKQLPKISVNLSVFDNDKLGLSEMFYLRGGDGGGQGDPIDPPPTPPTPPIIP